MNDNDAASLLDHPLISQRYFFPLRVPIEAPTWVDVGGARLACKHYAPHPDGKTVVHFHGNGEVVAHYTGDYVQPFKSFGVNLFLAEYRGYGGSTGTPVLGGMLDDVRAILAATGQPPERLFVFGRSVGSLYAIHATTVVPDLAGLILESAIADPFERLVRYLDPADLGATAEELRAAVDRDLDHRAKLEAYRGRTLILHARHDTMVDASHAERLASWAGGPTTLELLDHGGHNDIMIANLEAYLTAIGMFVTG